LLLMSGVFVKGARGIGQPWVEDFARFANSTRDKLGSLSIHDAVPF